MAVFGRKIWSAFLFFVTLHCQREGKAVVARDRLSRFRDSLIREIISCIKDPYQLYNGAHPAPFKRGGEKRKVKN